MLSIVGLAPLASVGWILIDVNREALTTSHQQRQLQLASSIAREVEVHVDAVRQRVAGIADRVAHDLRGGGALADAELARLRDESGESFVVYLRYVDRSGRTSNSDPDTILPDVLEAVLSTSLDRARERNSVGPAIDRTWMSDPVIAAPPGRDALLIVSSPVQVGNTPRGAVAAVVHFGAVWDLIVGGDESGQTVFALDREGVPFVSSDPREVLPGMAMGESELVQRFRTSAGRARETTSFLWTVGGVSEAYLGSYETTPIGWGIFVQAREDDVYQPIRVMVQSTLSWAAVALCLAILAAIVFARTLSTPIDRLAAATRGFADGDFSRRVKVRSNNEIGELAETFNGMADELESHIEKLKKAAEENANLFLGTIRALANAIDAKDPYTRGHSVRVNRYAVIIARCMELEKSEVEKIHVASVMHDVGKIGIDDKILQKPGALTREEFEVMKTHTTRGAEIMAPIPQMREIIPGLRSHHERWNGSGYPDGLRAEEIPLMGRIIAVADTFDAMTTKRPYQEPFSFDAAVARINELKGLGFDERVVEAFNRAYAAGEFGTEPMDVGAADLTMDDGNARAIA